MQYVTVVHGLPCGILYVYVHTVIIGALRRSAQHSVFQRKPRGQRLRGKSVIACAAVPFTSVNALVMYFFQAMGKGTQATILAVCRQGALNIPMLFLMNWLVGLYGMIRVQLIIEVVMLPFMLGMYFYTICNYLKSHANGLAHFL